MVNSSCISFAELINPAYNPNVASHFPQPIPLSSRRVPDSADSTLAPSDEKSLVPGGFDVNTTNRPHTDVVPKSNGFEPLHCEICSINCNSREMFGKHLSGKKHIEKIKAQNTDTSMLNPVKIENISSLETKMADNGALPGLEDMSTTNGVNCKTQALYHQYLSMQNHALVIEGKDGDTTMLEPSSISAPVVSVIQNRKQQECSASVAGNTCTSKEVNDEIVADKRKSTQLKADYSVDQKLHASNASAVESTHIDIMSLLEVCASEKSVIVCKVCNIFSYSRAALEKHLAGKTHVRKVKHLSTMMSLPVSAFPIEVLKSNNLKPAGDTNSSADPSSADPVVNTELKGPCHSESGTSMLSPPNACGICNIKCNSRQLFNTHLAGKKHASKVRKLGESTHVPCLSTKGDGAPRDSLLVQPQDQRPSITSHPDSQLYDAPSINPMNLKAAITSDKSVVCTNSNVTPNSIPATPPKDDKSASKLFACLGSNGAALKEYGREATRKAPMRGETVQFGYCDVCKLYCTSSELLSTHVMGETHLKQLKKLEELEKGTRTPEIIETTPRTVASAGYQYVNQSSVSELSTMVLNQVESPKGTINSQNQNNMQETSQDAYIGCTLCKVVCNSQITLSAHLSGRKHAAILRKIAESEMVDSGFQKSCS